MELLAREHLLRTGPVDHADWNFKPVLGAIQRERFRLISRLIGDRRFNSLLEIGYGSGIFCPELARHASHLSGIDIHSRNQEVTEILAGVGIPADLRQGSMTSMPFPDHSFDCAVSVSAMEFVDDIDAACAEIKRVLKPGGRFCVVTPGKSPMLDFGLWILTRESASKDFGPRRERVAATLCANFEVEEELRAPVVGNSLVCLYRAFRLVR